MFVFVYAKNYVNADAQFAEINIGGRACANMAMLATAIFDHLFIKRNISAMDRLVVVKFYTSIANGWLYMTQIKIMVIIFYS